MLDRQGTPALLELTSGDHYSSTLFALLVNQG
jgi:hypothetical protein